MNRQDEARAALRLLFGTDVEPDRRVERRLLRDQQMGQLFGEHAGIGVRGEVPVARSPPRDGVDDPADHLANGTLALGGSELSAEILLSDDVRGVLGPGRGEFHAPLLERVAAFLVVGDDGIPDLPRHLVEGMDPFSGEVPLEREPAALDADVPGLGRHDSSYSTRAGREGLLASPQPGGERLWKITGL